MTANRVSPAVLAAVLLRDMDCCAVCGGEVYGDRGTGWSIHHRRRGGMGGDRRADANTEPNLIVAHGSGTTSCHGRVHANRVEAYDNGWSVRAGSAPASEPICHAVHGRVFLDDAGSYRLAA